MNRVNETEGERDARQDWTARENETAGGLDARDGGELGSERSLAETTAADVRRTVAVVVAPTTTNGRDDEFSILSPPIRQRACPGGSRLLLDADNGRPGAFSRVAATVAGRRHGLSSGRRNLFAADWPAPIARAVHDTDRWKNCRRTPPC